MSLFWKRLQMLQHHVCTYEWLLFHIIFVNRFVNIGPNLTRKLLDSIPPPTPPPGTPEESGENGPATDQAKEDAGESSKEKEEEEESAQAADSEAVDERDQPANGKSYCLWRQEAASCYRVLYTPSQIFSLLGAEIRKGLISFLMFSLLSINRHKLKWKFSRGLT